MGKLNFKHNENTKYYLYHNDKILNNNLQRVILMKNYISKFINTLENDNSQSYYFIHGEKGLNTYLFKRKFDVVFTNKDNEIIYLEKEFSLNKISHYYEDLKFIYLLPLEKIKSENIKIGDELKHSRIK